jgi:hypothetical protein
MPDETLSLMKPYVTNIVTFHVLLAGYEQAVGRFDQNSRTRDARQLFAPLFEALNWAVASMMRHASITRRRVSRLIGHGGVGSLADSLSALSVAPEIEYTTSGPMPSPSPRASAPRSWRQSWRTSGVGVVLRICRTPTLRRDVLPRRRSKPSPPTNGSSPIVLHKLSLASCCRRFVSLPTSSSLLYQAATPELLTLLERSDDLAGCSSLSPAPGGRPPSATAQPIKRAACSSEIAASMRARRISFIGGRPWSDHHRTPALSSSPIRASPETQVQAKH